MADPITQITTHLADAKARDPGWLVDATNLQDFLDVLVQPTQNVEDVLIDMLDGFSIATAVGVQLDIVGSILALERTSAGESDTSYRTRLFGRSAALSKSGETEALISVWLGIWEPATRIYIQDLQPATVEITAALATDPDDPDQDAAAIVAIDAAKAGGVLIIPMVAQDNVFLFGDAADADVNGDVPLDVDHGLGDVFDIPALGVWSFIGELSLGPSGANAVAALNTTDVVLLDSTNKVLRLFRWDSGLSTFALVGTPFAIVGAGSPSMAAMNSTDIALLHSGTGALTTYRWDNGTETFSLIGTPLPLSSFSNSALSALSETDMAVHRRTDSKLEKYRWDTGALTWSLIGNAATLGALSTAALAGLNEDDLVVIDDVTEELTLYRWNDLTEIFEPIGTPLPIAGITAPALSARNATDVAFLDQSLDKLRLYRLDAATLTFSFIGVELSVTGSGPVLTFMNHQDLAWIDSFNDDLRKYRTTLEDGIPPGPGQGGNLARLLT